VWARPAGAFAATAAAVLVLTAVPFAGDPLRRLAGGEGDGPDPTFDVPMDTAALRTAAETIPDDATYATAAPGGTPLEQGNIKAGGQLYLAHALPLQDASAAEWQATYLDGRVTVRRAR
jgi:hypothetical protein